MNIPRFMLLLAVLAGACGWAVADDALYIGEAVIEDNRGARAPILEALNQVLVRLTGRVGEDVVSTLGLDVDEAASLSLGRQFRRVEIPRPDDETVEQRRLRVEFDPESVNGLLDEGGLLRWGAERPEFVLWIVVEGERGAEYPGEDRMLQYAIDQAAFRYGFELARPILDASDRVEVTPADIRGGFTGVAVPAMKRYGADGVIMLDLRPNREFWTGRWSWRIGDQETAFQRSGASRREVVELGLGRIAESLAARFAVGTSDHTAQRIVVSGIDTAAHYKEVTRFLGQLTGIESVRLVSARGSEMTFTITTSTDGLRRRIDLTGPLEFRRHDLAGDTLYYRFVL